MDTPNFVTLEHPSDEQFSGKVEFHIPTIYEQIGIDARKAQLSGPAGYDALSRDAQYRVTMVATLERVIDTAPKGFYADVEGRPYLSFEKFLELDEPQLIALFNGYYAFRSWFREGREGARAAPSTSA